ncbi:MAG TPA: signal peptidase I [Candidatus Saccharimonadales bacterium]|jgi:signal peptidase I|nr:signal peptidase I [Candidatus Saccharimonadales bacterium]
MASAPPPSPTFKKSVAREYLESLVVAFILATFIRTFIVQAFKIPTGSMETNLLIGDHLLVNKVVYSPSLLPFEDAILAKKPIRRGHVVVFKYPEEPTRDFIKRVIGLPGETVEIREKVVYIDGKPLDEPYVHFLEPPLHPGDPEFGLRIEGRGDNWGPRVVPPGMLFVLGDNRDNSKDSRYWDYLPIDQVKGRALMVYWSYEASREEYRRTGMDWVRDTLAAFGKTRWRRFFHLIR